MTDGETHLGRDALERLQALFVRLLFCQRTIDAFTEDPPAVLREHGLPASTQRMLPDPRDENFIAEIHGRRTGVIREVSTRFERTVAFFDELRRAPQAAIQPLSFNEFLSSDYFLDAGKSLPHPHGVGPGYESISKFYFWLRNTYGTDRPDAHEPLRTAVNIDFGLYLIYLRSRPCHPYYDRFKGGVCWLKTPGQPAPLQLLTEEMVFATVENPAKIQEILRVGIVDLDTVAPEPWELKAAI